MAELLELEKKLEALDRALGSAQVKYPPPLQQARQDMQKMTILNKIKPTNKQKETDKTQLNSKG